VERVGFRPPVVQKRTEEGEVVLEACHAILPYILTFHIL
jgi:hypothetical protein